MIQEAAPGDTDHAGEAFFRCDPGAVGWGNNVADPQLFLWLPAGAAGPDPRVLAFEAIDKMQLRGIDVGMAPPAGTAVLVNAPVWLWADNPSAATWGPTTATAAAGRVTVTATARVRQVEWSTGDGAEVVCGRGTPYGAGAEPSCSHTYRTPGTRSLTARTTWVVDWSSTTGVGGTETVDTESTVSVEVREARALVTARN